MTEEVSTFDSRLGSCKCRLIAVRESMRFGSIYKFQQLRTHVRERKKINISKGCRGTLSSAPMT